MIKFIEFFGWDADTRQSFRRDLPAMLAMFFAFCCIAVFLVLFTA